MVVQGGLAGSSAIGKWSKAFGELHRRIGHRFCRSEARERARRYLLGLLGRVERKNGWQLAEAIGERDPQGAQRLLDAAKWDADAVREGTFLELESNYEWYCNRTATEVVRVGTQEDRRSHCGRESDTSKPRSDT
jgi:hypothetical protein